MYARPKCSETDEDLLRLQEEFFKNKSEIKLAATVVSDQKDEKENVSQESCISDIQDQLANTFEAIPDTKNIGQIVEKASENYVLPKLNFNTHRGFPTAKRRDGNVDESKSGGSIFSQQIKKIKLDQPLPKKENKIDLPNQSLIVTGTDKEVIHLENITKLNKMSEHEILEERERLLESMDPALITFLRSRRQKYEASQNRNPTIQQQNEAAKNIGIEEITTTKEILDLPNSDKWLNFKTVETSKLAWMKDVEFDKIDKNKSFEARFDFEGWLLPYSEEGVSEKSRVLYHHGEEPNRPGYTLQELFQLSRSNIIQQKIIALNTIANVLSLNSTGVYDDIIDIPLEQIFFVVRYCLDDNTPSVLNASIKAMRNLIYSQIDETCLDCLLGFSINQVQPLLAVEDEPEDDNTVNDQQLAEKNLIKCLARTEILTRIRYVIKTVKPSVETIVYCMDILTRLVRDSQFILDKVWKCENLLTSILENFIPSEPRQIPETSPYGLPLLQAVKFVRILASRSVKITTHLVEKTQIMNSVLKFLSSEIYSQNTNGLKLQSECLHLWSLFAHYNITIEYFTVSTPVLLEMLRYHFNNTNIDMTGTFVRQGHASALLGLISAFAKDFSLISSFLPLIEMCATKWICQFKLLTDFQCGKLQIISQLFNCLTLVNRVTNNLAFKMDKLILEMLDSPGFHHVTKTVKNGSMLLNNYETHKTGTNLCSLEVAAWQASEHVIPLIQSNSSLPFLCSLSNYVQSSHDKKVKQALLSHTNIKDYLDALRNSHKYYLTSNWFTRVESCFILNILKISIDIRVDLDTCIFYEVAVKCLCIFQVDQKTEIEIVLRNIVFDSQFYPSEVLMKNLTIDQRCNNLNISLNNLDEILSVYIQVLGLKNNVPDFSTNLCLDRNIGNVIPIDWIYTPIIVLYSNQQHNKQNLDEIQQVFIVRNCLRWVLIYETYFPKLASEINATDRFCRIACVFLGSDNLFLIEEIHNLLELCLNNIISKCEASINFNKEIQGLNNFQDFFIQLLEQYQAISYGDILFGNFILVPLSQRHSIKWRKTLWSEYLGVVEIFNVTPEQCVCALESFLSPPEEDISLLKCYKRAIASNSIRKHSILYKVAKHHVEQYILSKKNKV